VTTGLSERTQPVFVGVTGHRFLAEVDKLTTGIDEALDAIESAFPRRSITVVNSLAEGADQLATRRVMARKDAGLMTILPFSQAQVRKAFQNPEDRTEFGLLLDRANEIIEIPAQASRNDAYVATGREILEHIDILLALWDGCAAHGRGGTGAVVHLARSRGLPIAWVHAGNRKPGTHEPTTLGIDQGQVTFERFPAGPACHEEKKR
jgi:hypothetical protein